MLIGRRAGGPLDDPVERMMYLDTMTYLPDDILTKVDRATMAASLEGRMPFLDPEVAALAWRLPPDLKVRAGTGKWALRHLLHRYVPAGPGRAAQGRLRRAHRRLAAGPAAAVGRGPPRARRRLERRRAARAPRRSARCGREHLSGRHDRQFELWDVLMFQAWAGRPRDATPPALRQGGLSAAPGTGVPQRPGVVGVASAPLAVLPRVHWGSPRGDTGMARGTRRKGSNRTRSRSIRPRLLSAANA